MKFKEYAEQWVVENVPASDIYGLGIREQVLEIAMILDKQDHSGHTRQYVIGSIIKLLQDWHEQKPLGKGS